MSIISEYEIKLPIAIERAKKATEIIKNMEKAISEANSFAPSPFIFNKRRKASSYEEVLKRLHEVCNEPANIKLNIDYQKRLLKEKEEKEKKELEDKKKKEAEISRRDKAILWLAENTDLKLGVDFSSENAIQKANDVAYNKEVNRTVEELRSSGEWVDFSGKNCDDCIGWNGESRRCNCGNRRVYWGNGGDFEKPYIYGEAD